MRLLLTSYRRHPGPSLGSVTPLWLPLLCALAVFLLSAGAQAHAPMCDPVGASVDAPIPALPAVGGEIRVLGDCPSISDDGEAAAPEDRLRTNASEDTVERALPWAEPWVGPAPARSAMSKAGAPPRQDAVRWSVYRPPRLRA